MKKRIKKILNSIRKITVEPWLRRMMGMRDYEEEINSLYYIINRYMDITDFPKATGLLRKVQLGGAEMLRIFHEVCTKHGLSYWLDYGTLLGAVRHKGFIPWDDDIDVAMSRDEYNKIKVILPMEMQKYGIEVATVGIDRIALCIWDAGIILDIFPVDKIDEREIQGIEELKERIRRYRKYYVKNGQKVNEENLIKKKEAIIGNSNAEQPIWYDSPEFEGKHAYKNDVIFPLKTMDFEGYEFFVPNNCSEYLKEIYGDYMGFPHGGILHHNGGENQKMHENSLHSGIDMEKTIENLKTYKVAK